MCDQSSRIEPVVIVGAGVFGLTTALELSKRGYTDILVLDRFLPPVPDGSSVDISRVIRMDYADPVYAQLAKDALEDWRTTYRDFYRECGFVLVAQTSQHPYIEKCKNVLRTMKQSFVDISKTSASNVPHNQVDLTGVAGLYNANAGWADAKSAISHLAQQCCSMGISFRCGRQGTVISLLQESSGAIKGVKTLSGTQILSRRVILATGAWSTTIINLSGRIVSTSQPIGFIQLSPEEADSLRKQPIVMNMSTGVFCFPPTDDNILKFAQHGYGFETRFPVDWVEPGHKNRLVSAPPRQFNERVGGYLPDDADRVLRNGLKAFYPQFADRPWSLRRLCWYSDTPLGDFILDHHPQIKGLFLATGGSGHAFKFLPVLGKHVADCFEGIASQSLQKKWGFRLEQEPQQKQGDGSRAGAGSRVLTRVEQAKL